MEIAMYYKWECNYCGIITEVERKVVSYLLCPNKEESKCDCFYVHCDLGDEKEFLKHNFTSEFWSKITESPRVIRPPKLNQRSMAQGGKVVTRNSSEYQNLKEACTLEGDTFNLEEGSKERNKMEREVAKLRSSK